jgi:hypothetical protein
LEHGAEEERDEASVEVGGRNPLAPTSFLVSIRAWGLVWGRGTD